jgi:hypothetical protein
MMNGPSPKICGSLVNKFSTRPFSLAFENDEAEVGILYTVVTLRCA